MLGGGVYSACLKAHILMRCCCPLLACACDAAVIVCRLYVPVFLPQVDMSPYPNVVKYMER